MIRAASHRHAPTSPYSREVDAYNAAFEELGVEWQLDASVYARHVDIADPKVRLAACIEAQYPHLLKAYDRAFIGDIASAAALRRAA